MVQAVGRVHGRSLRPVRWAGQILDKVAPRVATAARRLLTVPVAAPVENDKPCDALGNLDVPADIVVQRTTVAFHGWALIGTVAPSKVTVVVNGGRRVEAEVGDVRADVPEYLGEPAATAACGWMAAVDLTREPAGDLRIQVEVAEPHRLPRVIVDRLYALRGDGLTGAVDEPADGAVVPGRVLAVRGWAHALDGVARVEVYVDGHNLGPARLGLPRPDLHGQDPTRYGPALGWEFRRVIDAHPGTVHDVAVAVTDRQGHTARLGSAKVCLSYPLLNDADVRLADALQARSRAALDRIVDGRGQLGRRRDVMVFTHSLAIGGGQLYLQDLLRGMLPHLSACRVISAAGGSLARELADLGVEVSINPRPVPTGVASYEGAVSELAAFLRASGCTSVLLNTIGPWFAADAAQRAGIPTLWAVHESFETADWLELGYWGREVPPYVAHRLAAAMAGTSKMVFESEATRSMYVADGVPPGVASTVAYGVDVDAITAYTADRDRTADRIAHELPADGVVLLCMGVFEERKGQLWLAEAFVELLDAHPSAILVMVGDHGSPYAQAVRDLVRMQGLGDRVRTVPITPDGWIWYSMADVLISASDIESLPRSFLEAMAFGCPVLSVSVFGVPELITDGETGWLMTPRDTRSLLAGMHRVLGLSDETRRAVGAAGRDLVRESYRADGYVGVYLDLIDEVEAFTPPAPPAVRTPSAPADSGVDG